MVLKSDAPYECHVFVCCNDRGGTRKSCADGDNVSLRKQLKEAVVRRGWKPRVRISASACLGLCPHGPNVLIYPQKVWFSEVRGTDLDRILAAVGKILEKPI